jgi:CRP-like cAMP-binding protein
MNEINENKMPRYNSTRKVSLNLVNRRSFMDTDRNGNEVKTLNDLEFFKMIKEYLGDKGLTKHMKTMRLGSFRRDQIIVKANRQIDTVFVILKGEVDQTDLTTDITVTLYEGQSFGGLTWKNKKEFSPFKVQAMTDCMIYLIDMEDYYDLMQEIEIEKVNRFTSYLRAFEVFQTIQKSSLEKIYSLKSDITFHKNQVVFREGEDLDGIYFIHKGEFLVTKKVSGVIDKLRDVEREVEILKKENELLLGGLIGKYNTKSTFFKKTQSHLESQRNLSDASNFNTTKTNNISTGNSLNSPPKSYEVIIMKL